MKKVLNYIVIFLVVVSTTSIFATETTIKKINLDKKTVVIKGTEADGFIKDNRVCFYNPTNSKKTACGTIRKTGKATSLVSLAPKAILRINKDFIVSTSQEKILGTTITNQPDKEALGADVQVEQNSQPETIVVSPFRVKLSYIFTAKLPITSKILDYDFIVPANTKGSKDSLWKTAKTLSLSPLSIATSFMYHINKLFSVSLGLNYTFLYPKLVHTDYAFLKNDVNNCTEAKLKESFSILGIFSDFIAYRFYLGPQQSNLYGSLGLSYDMFSLNFKATAQVIVDGIQTDEFEFANVDSKLNLIGLRLGSGYEFYLKENLGFVLGFVMTVPISGSPSYSGSSSDEHAEYLKEGIDVTQDLYNSLDVKKAFGFSISLSSFVQF